MIKKSSSVLVVALATFLFVIGVINIAKSDGLAPNAPSNINTYDITSNSISITWTDNSNDEDGFVVEESINGSDYFTVGSVMTDVINFTIPELRPNTEYWFRVAAFRGETISDYATMSEGVFTLPYILNAPSDIIVNLVETNDIDISWTDNSKDEEAFIIDESTNGLDYTNVGEVAADVNNFTIPNLSPNTEYWFRVAAYNNEATSDYATMSEGVFTLSGALNAPSDITVNMIGTDYENIIWTDNSSDEDGFTIDESNDGSNYYNVGTVMAEANNFTIPNLQPNTRYWFRVAAIRGADISDYSTTPNGSYTNALAPNSFEFAWHNDNNSLDIGWSGGVASSYIIFYTDSNSGFVTDNYYTLNNLACNTYYEFSIVGFGENQQFTDRVNFNYTTGTCLPIAPTEVTATLDSPSAITVAWSGGSGSAYLASYTESDFGTITSGWITDSSYQFTDLSCSTEYTFGVVAINEDGVQTDPVYVTQKTPACLQDPPSSLTAVADSPNSITVSWSDSGYNYYANYNDNEGSGSGWINGGSYQFTNLTCNTEYTFSVVSKNEDDVQTDPTFITQTTKACPPTAPTEVTATADSPTAITVNWSGGTASGYKASYSGADSGWTTEAFYQFTGLTCNTSYTFNVIAKNEDDLETDPVSITQTTKACPPTAPTEVTATADSPTAITVNWSGGVASAYKTSYEGDNSGWIADQSYQFTNLTCNTSYTFNVIAKNEDDLETDPVSVTQTTKACLPTAPTEVTATADSPTAITVNWSGGTASGYKASYSGADSGWTTEAFYQFTGLTCNTSYTFNVIAKNEDDVQTDPTFITQTTKACSVSFSGGGGIIYTTPVKPIIIPPVITPPIITTPPITNPTKPVIIKKFIFKKNLKLGDINNDVKELQKYLNAHGFIVAKIGAGSRGKETTKFGAATKAALIKFQKAKKIKPTNGLFGPLTRAAVNK